MPTTGEEKWQASLELIRTQLSPKTYDTWIEPLRFVSYKGDNLTISAPNDYVRDYIEEHCIEAMKFALHQTFGKNVRLLYSIPRENPGNPRADSRQATSAPFDTTPKPQLPKPDPNLSWNYTFDNFVEGTSNKLALTVAKSIARNPSQATFNPFFIYGPSGIGKTHLANAIGLSIVQNHPEKRVLFVPVHVFQAQYTDSVRSNKFNDFVAFYQTIDILIIDDIQELVTPKTQQVFFHIFNHLHQNRRHIVITSDRAPAQLQGLEERMLTRFKWGMTAEIERPDIQLRKDILRSKTYLDGLTLPEDVLDYIAARVTGSVRELEGVVNSIMAYSISLNSEIDRSLAQTVIERTVSRPAGQLTVGELLREVAKAFSVAAKDIASKSRKRETVAARTAAMYLSRKMLALPLAQIGREIGRRDHSTVLHACRQAESLIATDPAYRQTLQKIEDSLHSRFS